MKLIKIAILLTLTTVLFQTNNYAQKKDLDLKQVVLHPLSIYPEYFSQMVWRPDGNSFTYIDNKKDNKSLMEGFVNSKKTIVLLSLSELNNKLSENNTSTLKRLPSLKWIDENTLRFWKGDTLWGFNVKSKILSVLNAVKKGAENIDATDNNKVAYTIKNNLYIAVKGNNVQVTKSENEGIVNGQIVSRNEFGINKGTFWSPKADYLAFYRKDQSKVMDYPLVDISVRPAKLVNIKYPMAGSTSEHVTVGVYNLSTGKTVWLKTAGAWDDYYTGIKWGPAEKYIYVTHLNRDQNHLQLIKYDASTGNAVKTLFEETNDKYVQPLHGVIFVKNHPDEFIWYSKRDNWNHLYLYTTEGKLIKILTEGKWDVTDFNGFDKKGNNIFITTTTQSPVDRDYYKVNLKSGKMTKLTETAGVHNVIKNEDGSYFLDSYSSLTIPHNVELKNNEGKVVKSILKASNPFENYKVGKTKIFKLKSKDGYDLYCRMITPANFDSTKKYKTLVYVYGGPGIQLITNRWMGGAQLWLNYMAANGYVVFTLDNRGSANRSLSFEQVTFRNLGTNEIEDQKLGVNYLKTLPFVDTTKLGVFGWSFGGFMTTSLMTRTPGLFKVGVAGGAVINWKYYEVMYTERYMDTPQANPEGYKKSNLLNYVKNLKGKLMLLHGTMDSVVLWQHTLMFAKKAAQLGIPLDYYPYPGWSHHVGAPDDYQMYLKITNYFNNNL